MKNLLIMGAGRSATVLIAYLLKQGKRHGYTVTVADADLHAAQRCVAGHNHGKAVALNVLDDAARRQAVADHDLVVSMMPPQFHERVAHDCLDLGRHLATASYVTPGLKGWHEEVKRRSLVFMNEIGLDPGIDHMSAMQRIDAIRAAGGRMTGFRSSTGGLVAPESDDHPWHYKLSWNPRNVVLAGRGTARFLERGIIRYIPYQRLFRQVQPISVPGMGEWEVYANRDSLSYREAYGLQEVETLFRGTIRRQGFCRAWDALVKLGLTDDAVTVSGSQALTYAALTEAFLGWEGGRQGSLKTRLAALLEIEEHGEVMEKLEWLGLLSDRKIGLEEATPAQILQAILLEKWPLKAEDRDMVIMQHVFEYEQERKARRLTSTLIVKGNNSVDTAMARLVGLPLGIFANLLMQGKVSARGVLLPTLPEIYEPVMAELAEHGVHFVEEEA
ncbi:MAG TPA: saccharopine dehydrogenase C-terminal domain-containing protein [Chthoniobacteraceae bacterium]|nr:saccharopine dehydrogenase C-terminal domain-containing protein [Chthoniobacteraceae bacterium]